ncbi:hypothetical protein PIB30_015566 [Stylosanthes scabra]|uniref:Leucine-rich repeat-containing N-terminal plant-type domain-containing protein n=1 Tax=Stylosanthes scabra TaxID=79078 RepID=A0ABU6Q7T8_9FABA|nr:hypothetical protein [Stylosanthes scabra]
MHSLSCVASVGKNGIFAKLDYMSYPKTLSWIPSTDCCSWDGIECDELTGHVISIDLSSSMLYGSMDPNSTLFSLVHLRNLDLSDNDFNHSQTLHLCKDSLFASVNYMGTLPESIGNLTNLAFLSLNDNSFHGEIPRSLFRLENLEHLHLGYNFFEGKLALDMFLKLKMLNVLNLSHNKLSLFLENRAVNVTSLPPLQVLGLGSSNLHGEIPIWIMNLTSLYYLDLYDNNLQGKIPYSLFKLENLTVLDLAGNMLEGRVELDMLSKLKKLIVLGLGRQNKLSFLEGNITANVTFPSQIQMLDLRSCNLVHVPNFIQHLQGLTDLWILDNSINTIPSWIWNKTALLSLDMSDNRLTGEISPLICNLQSLLYLDLSSNSLGGMIPSCLGSFSRSLQFLRLKGNKLVGNFPQSYVKGNAIQVIDFSSNKLHGQLPRALVNCRNLKLLDLSHNHFNDSFPFWLGSLPKLKIISLRDNEFHGAIKCPLKYTFPQLSIIDLSHNSFSENLTSDIIMCFKSMIVSNTRQLYFKDIIYTEHMYIDTGLFSYLMFNKGVVMDYLGSQYFHHMVAVDLSCNKISGEIPDIMGSLNSLVVLNLSNNMFTGSIPASLGKLSNLEVLDLSLNSLSGNIPQQLTELTFLDFFNVSFNNLSGLIPENKQFSTFESNSFEGNKDCVGFK